ncbi:MAG TPA: hypothetical protein VIM57_06860 [Luteolibacter sp.]
MHYRQSILFFGLVLPLILAAALIGGAFYARQSVIASFAQKEKQFNSYRQNQAGAESIEKELASKRDHVKRWKALLSEETKSQVNNHVRKLQEALPSKEFQQTSTNYPPSTGGFGSVSAQRSSQIRLGFRGTYRTLQRAFLELETRMPQLQLQEIRIDANSTQASLNNVDVTYTAWEN